MFTKRNVSVDGFVEPQFAAVREAFQEHFTEGEEVSAQVSVVQDGKVVVDLWCSVEDPTYTGATVQQIWSSTKNLTALAVAMLVDRKVCSYDDKVSLYWPEFGKEGKEGLTIADVLRHEAGLPNLSQQLNIEDCFRENLSNNGVSKVIESETMKFSDPSRRREYHALSRGFILQELFRRIEPSKRSIGSFLKMEVFDPLGLNISIGLDEENQKKTKIADNVALTPQEVENAARNAGREDIRNLLKAFTNYSSETEGNRLNQQAPFKDMSSAFDMKFWNSSKARQAEIPSANGLACARDLAVVAGQLARGGGQLISPTTWQSMHSKPTEGSTFGMRTDFTQGGINYFSSGCEAGTNSDLPPLLPGQIVHYGQQVPRGVYGWGGYGGSIFVWHPEHNIGFAYVPTYLAWYDRGKQRAVHCLRKAIFDCL